MYSYIYYSGLAVSTSVLFFFHKEISSCLKYFSPFGLISSIEGMYLKLRNWAETSKLSSVKSFMSWSDAATGVNIIITNGILMEIRSLDVDVWERNQVAIWHSIPHNKITHQQQEIVFPQHENDIWPPAGKERKRSITKNPKIGGLPLIPIQHEGNATLARKNIEVG